METDDPTLLTPEEEQYFESRGATEMPVEEKIDAEEAKPVEPVAEKPPSLVPLATYLEERKERQALAQQVAEREKSLATLESRLNTLQEVWQPKTPVPNYDEDPIGAINYKLEETSKKYEDLQRAEQTRVQAEAARQQAEQLRTYGKAQADEFKTKQPDFYDAYNTIWAKKDAELQALGYSDPRQRNQFIAEYEVSIIQKAASEGANIAERLYELAKSIGYTPKQAEQAEGDGEKKLQTIAAGQAASKSIGAAGGTAPPAKMTLAWLANLSDDEFEAYTSDPVKWRKLNTER